MIRDQSFQQSVGVFSVFGITLFCYLVTLPNSITLEDAGLFQMVCHNGGIGHPPGYPLFVLACQQFVALPLFGSGVFAANFLSALSASAACALLFLVARQLLRDTIISVTVAVCFGLSLTFWSQAIIVEVYSLTVLMFLACTFFAIRFRESGQYSDLLCLSVVYGLALSNHWPLHLLATPGLFAIIFPRWKLLIEVIRQPIRLAGLFLGLSVGLLPYLSLFQDMPAFAVYGAVDSLDEFLKYVSRAAYNDQSELAGLSDRLHYQSWLLIQSANELHPLLGALALAGLLRSFRVQPVSVSVALVLIYLSGTTLLNLLLGFEFNEFRVAIFAPYPVVAYLALALWMGIGLQWLLSSLETLAAWSRAVLPAVACGLTFIGSYPSIATTQNSFAERYGEMVLRQVPRDSVLFVEGDSGVGLIGYLHYVRGDRTDLELRSWNNLVFPNRLISPFAPRARQDQLRSDFIRASDEPVYSTTHGALTLNRGLVYEHNVPADFACDGEMHGYIEYLVQLDSSDTLRNGHERDLLFQQLSVLTRQHVGLQLFSNPVQLEETRILNLLQTTLAGKLVILEIMGQITNDEAGKQHLRNIGEQAEQMVSSQAPRKIRALISAYRGQIELLDEADYRAARGHLESSIALYPHPDNPAACLLQSTYDQLGLQSDLDQRIKTALTCE